MEFQLNGETHIFNLHLKFFIFFLPYKIVVNCCGPYRFYGEIVVKACIEAGTHHVDISGEAQFIEGMMVKYHDLAKEKKAYVISACGFDSIPGEMGVVFAERNFPGTY